MYGLLAFIFVWVIAFDLLAFLRPSGAHPLTPRTALTVIAMAGISLLIFGMAWWTVRRARPWARTWAIAASLVLILTMSPFVFWWRLLPLSFSIIYAALLAIGIAGLIAFIPRNALANGPIKALKPRRVAGDGTSGVFDVLAWVVVAAGYFAGMSVWDRWSFSHHLQIRTGLMYWLQLILALGLTIFIHESGHALAGLGLGMKLRAFIVGPFHWRIRDGRWNFQFQPSHFLSAGGAAALVTTDPNQPRWREIVMIAAGPLANLCTGLIAIPVALAAVGSSFEQDWHFLGVFSTLSLVTFAANLIPLRPESLYSDGARIFQLLRGGPWADLHRALAVVQSSLVTPLRPRNFDIDAIRRASASFTHGRQALLLRLLASYYFLDSENNDKAIEALSEAEAIYHESASDIPAELHFDFVFDSAYLRHDAASARQWWDRMEAKKPTHLGVDYWLARSALLWIENHNEEAREAWNKTNALAQKLPTAGTYQFDRYRVGLLEAALNTSPATSPIPESAVYSLNGNPVEFC
ncbi:MAG: M50 family metallopeptidase [Terracidiphilus sp.]|jgi:hypothetical protein